VVWDDYLKKKVPPPFVPTIVHEKDVSNFDEEFTKELPVLTPIQSQLSELDQEEFRGFSYTAEWVLEQSNQQVAAAAPPVSQPESKDSVKTDFAINDITVEKVSREKLLLSSITEGDSHSNIPESVNAQLTQPDETPTKRDEPKVGEMVKETAEPVKDDAKDAPVGITRPFDILGVLKNMSNLAPAGSYEAFESERESSLPQEGPSNVSARSVVSRSSKDIESLPTGGESKVEVQQPITEENTKLLNSITDVKDSDPLNPELDTEAKTSASNMVSYTPKESFLSQTSLYREHSGYRAHTKMDLKPAISSEYLSNPLKPSHDKFYYDSLNDLSSSLNKVLSFSSNPGETVTISNKDPLIATLMHSEISPHSVAGVTDITTGAPSTDGPNGIIDYTTPLSANSTGIDSTKSNDASFASSSSGDVQITEAPPLPSNPAEGSRVATPIQSN
jgi:hypothetical protein